MIFFSDLDSTLIYSHRRETNVPTVWVERIEEKLQSYMTEKTYRFFQEHPVKVVPVTTRRQPQYNRLHDVTQSMGWHHALICNGAILLVDGEEDPAWSEASRECFAADLPAFYAALAYVRSFAAPEDIYTVEPFLFFFKPREHPEVIEELRERFGEEHLIILGDSFRIYILPAANNKGTAIRRYLERFGQDLCAAAGDSEYDIPMLNTADLSFYPPYLEGRVEAKDGHLITTEPFSDGICDMLAERRDNDA